MYHILHLLNYKHVPIVNKKLFVQKQAPFTYSVLFLISYKGVDVLTVLALQKTQQP